jgi:rod shape determining protein RodA
MMQLRIERRMAPHVPWGLLFAVTAVAGIGIWNLASASPGPRSLWSTQALYFGIGLLCTFAVATVDYKFLYRAAVPLYVLNIVALLALRFVGHKAKGAESWLVLGPVRFQPAEFMKVGVILMLAKFYHDTYRPEDDRYGLRQLWKPLLLVGVPSVLVLVQPDLGTCMMLLLSSATVILFGKIRRPLAIGLFAGLLALTGVIWNDYVRSPQTPHVTFMRHRLKPHQSQRIASWLSPDSDLKGANYHTAQSKIAVGSGGMFGKGWRQGTQTALSFLPEQHTDFIFSVWAEEHGFLSCALLLMLYGIILLASLGVAQSSRDRFGAFVAVGVAAVFFWQIFENIGMVSGLLPVTGITLPLMSYGGSSMLSMMIMVGLLVNVSMRRHIF